MGEVSGRRHFVMDLGHAVSILRSRPPLPNSQVLMDFSGVIILKSTDRYYLVREVLIRTFAPQRHTEGKPLQ